MSYPDSALKEQLMTAITDHFAAAFFTQTDTADTRL